MEAVALLRGALVFAEREGLFSAEMRSRMNLSSYASTESPAEALDVAWTGARHALERGYDGWAITIAGNAAEVALVMGEWDRIEDMSTELDVMGEWRNAWDFALSSLVCVVRSYRGRITDAHELLDRFVGQFPDFPDPQVRMTVLAVRAHVAFAEGDLQAAIRFGREADSLLLELGIGGEHLMATAVAVEARDLGRLLELADVIGRVGERGRLTRVHSIVAQGAAQVLGGDPAGLARIDEACATLTADGLRFSLAIVRRARYMLAPDDVGSASAADEVRTILTDLGALTLLRGLPTPPAASIAEDPAPAVAPAPVITPATEIAMTGTAD